AAYPAIRWPTGCWPNSSSAGSRLRGGGPSGPLHLAVLSPSPALSIWRDGDRAVQPMLASTVDVSLTNDEFVYEPKYDGIRTIALVKPGHPMPEVHLYSRLGNEKTSQFPAVARALGRFALKLRHPIVLDGEVVALDARG